MNGIHMAKTEWLKQLPSDISSLKCSIHYIYRQTSYVFIRIRYECCIVSCVLCVCFIANADTVGLTKWTFARWRLVKGIATATVYSWLFKIDARQALQWKVTFGIKINWKIVNRHANAFTISTSQPGSIFSYSSTPLQPFNTTFQWNICFDVMHWHFVLICTQLMN